MAIGNGTPPPSKLTKTPLGTPRAHGLRLLVILWELFHFFRKFWLRGGGHICFRSCWWGMIERSELGKVEKDVKLSFSWEMIEKSWIKDVKLSLLWWVVHQCSPLRCLWIGFNQPKMAAKYDKSTKDSSQIWQMWPINKRWPNKVPPRWQWWCSWGKQDVEHKFNTNCLCGTFNLFSFFFFTSC